MVEKSEATKAEQPPSKLGKPEKELFTVDVNDLNEEDRQLKEDLELLITRLKEPNHELYLPALEQLRKSIRSATTSMTSVPKPLKFLREHYETMKALYEPMPNEETKRFTADIVSILAMTMPSDKLSPGESLDYRLRGSREEIGSWGHEYVRHISGEIAQRWPSIAEDVKQKEELIHLVHSIVPYHMKHNAEAEAVDLVMDIERLDLIERYIDNDELSQRVCLYMGSCVPYVPDPENTNLLKTAMAICLKFNKHPDALRLAMQLGDIEQIKSIMNNCEDQTVQKQLAFMIGRQQIFLNDDNIDSELIDIMSNSQLNQHFLALGRELDILEPKTPEDIYKAHLDNGPTGRNFLSGSGSVDSARVNLASSFVNGFVNCGFGKDKLLLIDDCNKWLYKNKDHGMISATASLGLILLWDVDTGLTVIDKYLYSSEDNIKAGALLACGLVNCGVRNDCDPALALLGEYVLHSNQQIRIGAIIGIGLAYAGSNREDVIATLLPVLQDSKQPIDVIGIVAVCCGLIAVGSANSDVVTACLQLLMERDAENKLEIKNDPLIKYIPLAIALCYLGRQDAASTIQETLDVISNVGFKRISKTLLDICAYAATGNVLKIQNLLLVCSEKIGDTQDKASGDAPKKSTAEAAAANSDAVDIPPEFRSAEQAICTVGIALISMGENIGAEMAFRTFGHLLRYGDSSIKKAVPLALALTSISNPKLNILETLSKLFKKI
jgi:26S proteasome regulatory subunit N1